MSERLVSLFYLLMRDSLPTGALLDAVNRSKEIDNETQLIFTNKDLENMARDYVERLIETS